MRLIGCGARNDHDGPKNNTLVTMNVDSKPFAHESSLIAGRRISFVGRLGGINRKEAQTLVREQGGVMVDKLDPSVDLIVVGADQPLDEVDELLEDWISESVAEGRLRIINETQLWQELGLVDEDLDACRLYTPAMLARLLDVSISSIRRWHRRGLIRPLRQVNRLPYFDFQEVASARRIAGWIASGASPQSVESKLSNLALLYPNLQHPLQQLTIIIEGREVLLRKERDWSSRVVKCESTLIPTHHRKKSNRRMCFRSKRPTRIPPTKPCTDCRLPRSFSTWPPRWKTHSIWSLLRKFIGQWDSPLDRVQMYLFGWQKFSTSLVT